MSRTPPPPDGYERKDRCQHRFFDGRGRLCVLLAGHAAEHSLTPMPGSFITAAAYVLVKVETP